MKAKMIFEGLTLILRFDMENWIFFLAFDDSNRVQITFSTLCEYFAKCFVQSKSEIGIDSSPKSSKVQEPTALSIVD